MYLVGAEHPNKALASARLQALISKGVRLVTDAEVFKGILHRYTAIGRRDAIQPAFDALLGIVDEVLAIDWPTVESAKALLLEYAGLGARDAIHAASMSRHGVQSILTFDAGYEVVRGIERIIP